jgi:putative DNA primase/helicase
LVIRDKYPYATIRIWGDNDSNKTSTGEKKAHEAGEAVDGVVVLPPKPGDFNDLGNAEGLEAVMKCLETAKDYNSGGIIGFDECITPSIQPIWLPEPLRDMAVAVASKFQVPQEFAIAGCLANLSAAAHRKFKVEIDHGFSEHINLWIICTMPSGSRKSSALGVLNKPGLDWETTKYREIQPEIKKAENTLENIESRQKELRKKADKADQWEAEQLWEEINTLEEQKMLLPVEPRIFADDITTETLAERMKDQDEKMAIIEAEGGIFDTIAGRYGNGVPNLDLYLKSSGGETVVVDRKGKQPLKLISPVLTFAIFPQPIVLKELAKKPGFYDRGFIPRFLFLNPESMVGYRRFMREEIPGAASKRYRELIHKYLNAEWRTNEHDDRIPYDIKLTKDAFALWEQFYDTVEKELRPGGEFEDMHEWGNRLPGQAARLAGLFHLSTDRAPERNPVPPDTMEKALNLASALADHAKASFSLIGLDDITEFSKEIVQWIRDDRLSSFTFRECQQKFKGRRKIDMPNHVKPALEGLEERGFLSIEYPKKPPKTPGRKKSPICTVNPKTHEPIS